MSSLGDFKITVSREGRSEGRAFSISLRLLASASIVILSCLTALMFSGIHYYQMWMQSEDYVRLEQEVDRLRKYDEGVRLSAKQLNDQIAALQVMAQKLKIVAGFDEDALGGVGGPASKVNPIVSLSQRDLTKHFRSLDRKRISLQSELSQLQDYYTTREILMSSTPSLMPVKGYPSDRFGRRNDPFTGLQDFHPGIDISAPKGTKVLASADGLVVFAGRRLGYGKLVTIEHKFGISTRYGHLDRYTVKAGQRIRKGDILGYVGATGRATGSHLHYEVRLQNQALNPLRFFQDSL
ncbi:MAG: M23 family metallopeptidase [Acidobacteriota bacterium]|nr:MAG: M23 family metallopeptidase [Acidobacteriota bacterium]